MTKGQEDVWTFQEIITQMTWISPEVISALEHSVTAKEWKKNRPIVEQDELCDKWLFISEGLMRIMFTRDNKIDTLFFGGGGDIFTSFKSLCDNKGSVFRVEALTDCRGWEISHTKYNLLQQKYPELLRFENVFLRHQLYCLEESYRQRALLTSQERYEKFWLPREGKLQNISPKKYSRRIPLKVIAQYLSMSPEMLSRIRRGLIEQSRKKKE